MRFLKELLLSLLKTILLFFLTSVAVLSFLQQKFPPTFTNPTAAIEKFRALTERLSHIDPSLNTKLEIDPAKVIASRKKLLEDLEQTEAQNAASPAAKKKTRATSIDGIRLEVAEYKIRLLEYEMSQLKNEIKNLKSMPMTK